MGFFTKLFKRKEKNDEPEIITEKKESRSLSIEEVYEELWDKLTWMDKTSAVASIIESPREYALGHMEDFDNRGIDLEESSNEKLQVFAFIDLLIKDGFLYEFDYNVESEDFVYGFERMKTFLRYPNLKLRTLDEEEDIESWIKTLNIYWSKQGYRIYQIDIDSDSYVLFVSKIKSDDLELYNKMLPVKIVDTSASLNLEFDEETHRKTLFDIVLAEHKRLTTKEVINMDLSLGEVSHLKSKLGGVPYLDLNYDVPKSSEGHMLRFFGQINLEELPNHHLPLPKEGMIQYWLLDDNMYGIGSEGGMKVIYYPTVDSNVDVKKINTTYVPHDLGQDYYFMFEKTYSITFEKESEFMSRWDSVFDSEFMELWNAMFRDDSIDSLEELETYFDESGFDLEMGTGHKIGGYPYFAQWDPRNEERLDFDFLLLQIDSDFTDGMDILWGDAGVGNFFIGTKDLEDENFSDILYNWDCY